MTSLPFAKVDPLLPDAGDPNEGAEAGDNEKAAGAEAGDSFSLPPEAEAEADAAAAGRGDAAEPEPNNELNRPPKPEADVGVEPVSRTLQRPSFSTDSMIPS